MRVGMNLNGTDEPATLTKSTSLNPKCSIAKREASGGATLCEGGVGNDADGAGEAIRTSNDGD